MKFFRSKKPDVAAPAAPKPSLIEKYTTLRAAVAAGTPIDEALVQNQMTLKQYGYAMVHSDAALRAILDRVQARKNQRHMHG